MKNKEERQIERLQYWEGQLLRSSDFAAAQNADNQYRWWHNRALHNAYGVGLGLAVTKEGDRLRVGCGLAYDTLARELLVPDSLRLPFPQVKPAKPGEAPESRLLILQYNPGSTTQSELSCRACDSRKRTADPAWLRLSRFDPRKGVPIALVNWDATGAPFLADFDPPRALSIARPVLGSGVTPPDGTIWELWREVIPGAAAPPQTLGLQTRVNTAAAGFAEVPVYIAQLQIGALPDTPHVLPPPICRVDDAAPDSFLFRVWLPRLQSQTNDLKLTVPNTKIKAVSADRTKLTVDSNKDFQENDPVCLVGQNDVASFVKKIPDDSETTIEINPPFPDKVTIEKETLRLAFLNSLDRVASLIDGLTFFPGMVVLLVGLGEVTHQFVLQYYTVVVSGSGAVSLSPPITPNLHLGDNFKKDPPISEVPRIFVVSTASIDIALAVQSLGWHVCWVGAVCSSHPQFPCSDQVCEISVAEVC